jgi:hypothetical protein
MSKAAKLYAIAGTATSIGEQTTFLSDHFGATEAARARRAKCEVLCREALKFKRRSLKSRQLKV